MHVHYFSYMYIVFTQYRVDDHDACTGLACSLPPVTVASVFWKCFHI